MNGKKRNGHFKAKAKLSSNCNLKRWKKTNAQENKKHKIIYYSKLAIKKLQVFCNFKRNLVANRIVQFWKCALHRISILQIKTIFVIIKRYGKLLQKTWRIQICKQTRNSSGIHRNFENLSPRRLQGRHRLCSKNNRRRKHSLWIFVKSSQKAWTWRILAKDGNWRVEQKNNPKQF